MRYKYDIKIYGIEERVDNILKNKELLGLTVSDIFIKKSGDDPIFGRWPYTLMKHVFKQPVPEGVTHRLVLQDDNELCPNFLEYLDKIVNARPDDIIVLTALDYMKKDPYVDSLKSPYIPVEWHASGNAVVVPVKYIEPMFDWMDKSYSMIAEGQPHEDAAIIFFGRSYRINVITTIPSIVQHIGDSSTLCDYKYIQRTAYFSNWDKANWEDSTLNPIKKAYEIEKACSTKSEIKYFVRTTDEREFDYSPLVYGKLIDHMHNPVRSFIEQLMDISPYDAVLLEDDVILCRDFQNEIEKAIKENPRCIIQFFTDPDVWETSHYREHPFQWNQCTYYPKGYGKVIAIKMLELLRKFPKDQILYSQVESLALFNLGIPHYVYRPCLVQHKDLNSILKSNELMPNKNKIRNTPFFKDYLDDLGIDYDKAYDRNLRRKLDDYKDKHFEKLIKESKEAK